MPLFCWEATTSELLTSGRCSSSSSEVLTTSAGRTSLIFRFSCVAWHKHEATQTKPSVAFWARLIKPIKFHEEAKLNWIPSTNMQEVMRQRHALPCPAHGTWARGLLQSVCTGCAVCSQPAQSKRDGAELMLFFSHGKWFFTEVTDYLGTPILATDNVLFCDLGRTFPCLY